MATRKEAWSTKTPTGWEGFQLNVPSIAFLLGNEDNYEYKLPYTVAQVPKCARIHPKLYCCDLYFCCCLSAIAPPEALPFVDMVDQTSGHQVRYRSIQQCCRVPKILTFVDGTYVGHVSRTMRCMNRCYTCLEDYKAEDVLQVGLHDAAGNQLARINRNGKGKCSRCSIKFPCRCTGCCFVCTTCTCWCMPTLAPPCSGCLECDPACCECCVKGNFPLCDLVDLPCCCCACLAPAIWCPCPTCETKLLPNANTITYKEFDVLSSDNSQQEGSLQAVYRGNYPSAFTHGKDTPLKIFGSTTNSQLGVLLSAVSAGMAYTMGTSSPTFGGIVARPEFTSPGWDGKVNVTSATQIRSFVGLLENVDTGPKLDADLVVQESQVFGEFGQRAVGTQVRGWKLLEVTYTQGFRTTNRKYVTSVEQLQKIVKEALESQIGEFGTTFTLFFQLPDLEKQIATKSENFAGDTVFAENFNPMGGGFAKQLESVSVQCSCIRVCMCPANCNKKKVSLCSIPLYAQYMAADRKGAVGPAQPPPQVVMIGAPKHTFKKSAAVAGLRGIAQGCDPHGMPALKVIQ